MYNASDDNEESTSHLPSQLRGIPTVRRPLERRRTQPKQAQICALRAATGKAFTTVLAGFALTFISLPKAILTPALVAGLTPVLILQRPGMVKMPAFFTSAVARVAKLARMPLHTFVFISCFSEINLTRAPLVIALPPAFIAFAFMVFMGAIAAR